MINNRKRPIKTISTITLFLLVSFFSMPTYSQHDDGEVIAYGRKNPGMTPEMLMELYNWINQMLAEAAATIDEGGGGFPDPGEIDFESVDCNSSIGDRAALGHFYFNVLRQGAYDISIFEGQAFDNTNEEGTHFRVYFYDDLGGSVSFIVIDPAADIPLGAEVGCGVFGPY